MQRLSTSAPRLAVEHVDSTPTPQRDIYAIVWRIVNLTAEPLEISEAWLPHGQFHAERQTFDPALVLPGGGAVTLTRDVLVRAAAGEVIENGFLILVVRADKELWRVLVRMAVEVGAGRTVRSRVDAVTSHPVGFAPAQLEAASSEDRNEIATT